MRHAAIEYIAQALIFGLGVIVGFQVGFVFRPMYDDWFVKLFNRIWPEASSRGGGEPK